MSLAVPDQSLSPKRFSVYKREQAAISRRKLYPVTAFYSGYSVVMLAVGLRTAHPREALAFYAAGIPIWTFVEYFSHRFILHGSYKPSKKWYKFYLKPLNKYIDPLHWEHHAQPYDGLHIN